MAVQVRGRDFHPVVGDLAQRGLVFQPGDVVVQESLDFVDHVKSPRSMSGGSITLQKAMKS